MDDCQSMNQALEIPDFVDPSFRDVDLPFIEGMVATAFANRGNGKSPVFMSLQPHLQSWRIGITNRRSKWIPLSEFPIPSSKSFVSFDIPDRCRFNHSHSHP
jgi:hypothetical protein